jgi:uncharacterized protein YbaP (TraB family)
LFKITGNGLRKPSYVFGTLHLVGKRNYELPSKVMTSAKEAAIIYTEVEVNSINIEADQANQNMMSAHDSTLDKILSEHDYKKLGSFLSDTLFNFLPIEELNKFKPNAIHIGILNFNGCSPLLDVEEILIATYPTKKIIGFETYPSQIQMLMSSPIPEQSKNLIETIDNWNKVRDELWQMRNAYLEGNLDLINKLLLESKTFDVLYNGHIIGNRREVWVSKMPTLMKKQSVFFAVGAGHLPGKNGVLALLKAKGYTVTPIALQ